MSLLKEDQIYSNLKEMDHWSYSNAQIQKEFSFRDFVDALAFVNKVALESEKMDHHPDILLHSWNKVKISISTHSEGGVTEKDFELARRIDSRLI
jgi:4a-hydroxytetrahydrobiopterin dehydratase